MNRERETRVETGDVFVLARQPMLVLRAYRDHGVVDFLSLATGKREMYSYPYVSNHRGGDKLFSARSEESE